MLSGIIKDRVAFLNSCFVRKIVAVEGLAFIFNLD